jgi:hypothetical protein
MLKPADLYISVLDVFSILLPGAVVSWFTWHLFSGDDALTGLLPQDITARWLAFVLASFAAGHIVFMLASLVDITFDSFRKQVLRRTLGAYRGEVERQALEAATALRLVTLSAEPLPGRPNPTTDRALAWAREILHKPEMAARIPEPTNTYQWSRAVLRLRAPASLAEVLRLEADSKFFRSLFVVFLILAICSLFHILESKRFPIPVWVLLPLAAISYWRYAEQRQKGVIAAYRAVIVVFTVDTADQH